MTMLLDTNVLISLFQGEPSVTRKLDAWTRAGRELALSIFTIAELLAFRKGTEEDEQKILEFAKQFPCIAVTNEVATLAGKLKQKHRITIVDAIIAATALIAELPLVTRNVADFKNIPKLTVIRI